MYSQQACSKSAKLVVTLLSFHQATCNKLAVVALVATCCVQAILDLLRQLVTSLMKLSTLLEDANYLSRAGDIRLVETTCNKSDEVVNLVTRR